MGNKQQTINEQQNINIKFRNIIIKLDISPENEVDELKQKIYENLEIGRESYSLFFNGREIGETETYNTYNLIAYDIKNNDTIKVIEKQNKEIYSIIKSFSEYGIDIDIPTTIQDTKELKLLISRQIFIPIYRLKIFFGNEEIKEEQKIKGLSENGSFDFDWDETPEDEEDFVYTSLHSGRSADDEGTRGICGDEQRYVEILLRHEKRTPRIYKQVEKFNWIRRGKHNSRESIECRKRYI